MLRGIGEGSLGSKVARRKQNRLYFTPVKAGWRAHYGSFYASSKTKGEAVHLMIVALLNSGRASAAYNVMQDWDTSAIGVKEPIVRRRQGNG